MGQKLRHLDIGLGYRDTTGHGTHVAGIAVGKNVGLAPYADLVVVRVISGGYGSSLDMLNGISAVTNDIKRRNLQGKSVVNISMALSSGADASVDLAMKQLHQAGAIVVVAAGNSRMDSCQISPARSPYVITVGSINRNYQDSEFSNFGDCVNVNAPGGEITSAYHDGSYAIMSGTSMAAPIVSAAALGYDRKKLRSVNAIIDAIIKGSTKYMMAPFSSWDTTKTTKGIVFLNPNGAVPSYKARKIPSKSSGSSQKRSEMSPGKIPRSGFSFDPYSPHGSQWKHSIRHGSTHNAIRTPFGDPQGGNAVTIIHRERTFFNGVPTGDKVNVSRGRFANSSSSAG
jgi:subtilisin family serine protease